MTRLRLRGWIRWTTVALLSSLLVIASGPVPRAQAPATAIEPEKIFITVGRSTVLGVPFDLTRVAITNPAVADATAVAWSSATRRP